MGFLRFLLICLILFLSLLPQKTFSQGEISVKITPNPLKVTVFTPEVVYLGDFFVVSALIENKGLEMLKEGQATLYLPSGLALVGKPSPSQNFGVLKGESSKKVRWKVQALEVGNFIILVEAQVKDKAGNFISSSGTTFLQVQPSLAKKKNFFVKFWQFLLRF